MEFHFFLPLSHLGLVDLGVFQEKSTEGVLKGVLFVTAKKELICHKLKHNHIKHKLS